MYKYFGRIVFLEAEFQDQMISSEVISINNIKLLSKKLYPFIIPLITTPATLDFVSL